MAGRQITVLNGSSSQTDMSSLILLAATLGAFGYGYMWWNGLSFSVLIYGTECSTEVAVDSLKENLRVSMQLSRLAHPLLLNIIIKAKKHLLQKVLNLGEKIVEQRELQNQTLNEVRGAHVDVENVQHQLHLLAGTVCRLCLLGCYCCHD
ncbi:uncharacterized protein LOC141644185 [Silene latifolia]|uniref:uncharacterized protein LOC141644185 n=1 Tax=Silene latifolia TaxID=37657 RepID=UPI003D777E81